MHKGTPHRGFSNIRENKHSRTRTSRNEMLTTNAWVVRLQISTVKTWQQEIRTVGLAYQTLIVNDLGWNNLVSHLVMRNRLEPVPKIDLCPCNKSKKLIERFGIARTVAKRVTSFCSFYIEVKLLLTSLMRCRVDKCSDSLIGLYFWRRIEKKPN